MVYTNCETALRIEIAWRSQRSAGISMTFHGKLIPPPAIRKAALSAPLSYRENICRMDFSVPPWWVLVAPLLRCALCGSVVLLILLSLKAKRYGLMFDCAFVTSCPLRLMD